MFLKLLPVYSLKETALKIEPSKRRRKEADQLRSGTIIARVNAGVISRLVDGAPVSLIDAALTARLTLGSVGMKSSK
jgi:hypothetical protein